MDAGDTASRPRCAGAWGVWCWSKRTALPLLEAWGGGLSAALFTQIFKDALHLKQLGSRREGGEERQADGGEGKIHRVSLLSPCWGTTTSLSVPPTLFWTFSSLVKWSGIWLLPLSYNHVCWLCFSLNANYNSAPFLIPDHSRSQCTPLTLISMATATVWVPVTSHQGPFSSAAPSHPFFHTSHSNI